MTDTRTPEEIAQRRIEWFKAGNPNTADPEWRDVFPADEDDDDEEGYQPAALIRTSCHPCHSSLAST